VRPPAIRRPVALLRIAALSAFLCGCGEVSWRECVKSSALADPSWWHKAERVRVPGEDADALVKSLRKSERLDPAILLLGRRTPLPPPVRRALVKFAFETACAPVVDTAILSATADQRRAMKPDLKRFLLRDPDVAWMRYLEHLPGKTTDALVAHRPRPEEGAEYWVGTPITFLADMDEYGALRRRGWWLVIGIIQEADDGYRTLDYCKAIVVFDRYYQWRWRKGHYQPEEAAIALYSQLAGYRDPADLSLRPYVGVDYYPKDIYHLYWAQDQATRRSALLNPPQKAPPRRKLRQPPAGLSREDQVRFVLFDDLLAGHEQAQAKGEAWAGPAVFLSVGHPGAKFRDPEATLVRALATVAVPVRPFSKCIIRQCDADGRGVSANPISGRAAPIAGGGGEDRAGTSGPNWSRRRWSC